MDISGVDFPEREKRFEVVYHLLSVRHAGRIRVKTYAGEADPVPSAVEVFKGADWCVMLKVWLKEFSDIIDFKGMNAKLGIFLVFSLRITPTC